MPIKRVYGNTGPPTSFSDFLLIGCLKTEAIFLPVPPEAFIQ
jgi:hypothetical protein